MAHLGLQRTMIPGAQVSSLTAGNIAMTGARKQTWDGPEGAFDALITVGASGSVNSISITGIPAGYKHLQLRLVQKDNYNSPSNASNWRFNGDSSSVYSTHRLFGNGSTATSDAYTSQSGFGELYASNQNSSYGATVCDILDYSSETKYKTVRMFTGFDANGSGQINVNSAVWMSYAPISSISFTIGGSGVNWSANSSFALYGVK